MKRGFLSPTPDQTYEIRSGERGDCNFRKILRDSQQLQAQGDIEEACNVRFSSIQRLQELLDDNDEIRLEWGDENSRAAIELVYLSAIDHFLINDFEISSALLELALDIDPEDHLEASNLLAFDYLAMGEYELFDEVINDISDKYASRTILLLWAGYLRDGALPSGELHSLKTRFSAYYTEFTAEAHPVDATYIAQIESPKPTPSAQARELWLQTENLWGAYPQFINALRGA